MGQKGYTTINLPTELIEELKIWRQAFNNAYGRPVSYAEMLRGMLDSLEDTDPGVVEEMDSIITKHPELKDKLGNFRPV